MNHAGALNIPRAGELRFVLTQSSFRAGLWRERKYTEEKR